MCYILEDHMGRYMCWWFTFCCCVLAIFLTTYQYREYPNFDEELCNIVNVSAPTQLPTYNNTRGWKECSCGKRCTAWTPCISLYSHFNPEFSIRPELYTPDSYKDCTFFDETCKDGEDARYTMQKMEEAREIMTQYLHQNITCYVNSDASRIYLNKSYKLGITIIASVIAILLLMCACCYQYIRYKEAREDKKTIIVEHDIEAYPYPIKDQEL